MAELAALNVKINGDAAGLRAALQSAEDGLQDVSNQARATQRQVAASSAGMGRLGQVLSRNGFAITNAANQFSDLSVQMAMGVPASRALSQQLPQLTAFMGPMVAVAGVAAGVLIGLAGSFLSARDGADTFKDSIDGLAESTQELRDQLFMAQRGLESMAQVAALREIEQLQSRIADHQEDLLTADRRRAREIRGAIELDQQRLETLQAQLEENQQLADEAERASDAIERITQANLGSFEAEVAALANELGIAADEARRLLNNMSGGMNYGTPLFRQGLGGDLLPPGQEPGGGGGGGRSPAIDTTEADLQALRDGFMSQEELQLAAYERQQSLLQDALERRLVTQEEYASLMEQAQQRHGEAMAQLDVYRYGTGVQQAGAFFGDMANAFQQGNDEMVRISRIFGAAQALIAAYTGAAEALKLPFPANLGAYAAVLGQGLAAVSAIQSVRPGSSGSGGGSVGAAGVGAGGAQQAVSRNVAVQLTGGDMFSRDQVVGLINQINEAVEDGAIVRLV